MLISRAPEKDANLIGSNGRHTTHNEDIGDLKQRMGDIKIQVPASTTVCCCFYRIVISSIQINPIKQSNIEACCLTTLICIDDDGDKREIEVPNDQKRLQLVAFFSICRTVAKI